MKCPDCTAKIKQTDYDPVFEWYECPKCGGGFTYDEILEAEHEDAVDSKRKNKSAGSSTANGTSGRGRADHSRPPVVAKGKKRRTEIAADDEAGEEQIEEIVAKTVKADQPTHHRDEIPTGQVVNIMADEIQEIYNDLGGELDDLNAREKALVIWREIHYKGHVGAREQSVTAVLCKAHRE